MGTRTLRVLDMHGGMRRIRRAAAVAAAATAGAGLSGDLLGRHSLGFRGICGHAGVLAFRENFAAGVRLLKEGPDRAAAVCR